MGALQGDEKAVSLLALRLEDCSWLVQNAAGIALERITTQETIAALEHLRGHSDDSVRRTVERVFQAVRDRENDDSMNGISAVDILPASNCARSVPCES